MTSVNELSYTIKIMRNELKNLRQEILKQKANIKKEAENILSLIPKSSASFLPIKDLQEEKSNYAMTPIGYISSCFKYKNGTPRQPSLCQAAKGTLKITKSLFTNPEHSLIGLNEFSHIWLIFVFHENRNPAVKAKVHPPRLNGASLGIFSTRSPHRPSAIGLSLTKLDGVKGDTLYMSGIDLLDGTPILDVKPYIPMYDNPTQFIKIAYNTDEEKCSNSSNETILVSEKEKNKVHHYPEKCKVPEFLEDRREALNVIFTSRAQNELDHICSQFDMQCDLDEKKNSSEIKQTIIEVLQNDPRSVYRKEKCVDRLYYFYVNNIHITCWFDQKIVEVLKVQLSEKISDNQERT